MSEHGTDYWLWWEIDHRRTEPSTETLQHIYPGSAQAVHSDLSLVQVSLSLPAQGLKSLSRTIKWLECLLGPLSPRRLITLLLGACTLTTISFSPFAKVALRLYIIKLKMCFKQLGAYEYPNYPVQMLCLSAYFISTASAYGISFFYINIERPPFTRDFGSVAKAVNRLESNWSCSTCLPSSCSCNNIHMLWWNSEMTSFQYSLKWIINTPD